MTQDENVWAALQEPVPGTPGVARPSGDSPPGPPTGVRTRLPVWAIVLIVIGGLFVGAFTLAFVGSKLRQDQGVDVWEATHYVFPDRIDGQTHTDTAATREWVQATEQGLDKGLFVYDVRATTYGDPAQATVAVLTARPNIPLNPVAQRRIIASNAKARSPGQAGTVEDPGPLGGTLTCGPGDGVLICTVVDAAGQMVIVMPVATGSAAEARSVRAVIEIHEA